MSQPSEDDIMQELKDETSKRPKYRVSKRNYNKLIDMLSVEKMDVIDIISGDTLHVKEYITHSIDNIVFVVNNDHGDPIVFSSIRSQAIKILGLYECQHADTMREFTGNRYILLSSLGCPCTGAVSYYPLKFLLNTTLQVFRVRETSSKTGTLASHTVRYMGDSMVSNAHCQTGTDQTYYEVLVPDSLMSVLIERLTTHEHDKYKDITL